MLGLRVVSQSDEFVELETANDDKFEIFGPGRGAPWQFATNDVVVGFLVDDIDAARDDLARTPGVELLGEIERGLDGYAWQHFRAPDGHVYELTRDPRA